LKNPNNRDRSPNQTSLLPWFAREFHTRCCKQLMHLCKKVHTIYDYLIPQQVQG
jgi:hypothetical protein